MRIGEGMQAGTKNSFITAAAQRETTSKGVEDFHLRNCSSQGQNLSRLCRDRLAAKNNIVISYAHHVHGDVHTLLRKGENDSAVEQTEHK